MAQPAYQHLVDGPGVWTAPNYVVDQLATMLRPPDGPPGDPTATAQAIRAAAHDYANWIWAAAAHAGAVWGLARNTQPIMVDISPERLAELRDKAS